MAEKDVARQVYHVPVMSGGRIVLARVDAGNNAQAWARSQKENERVSGVEQRRKYFDGRQYEDENDSARAAYSQRGNERLPEHLRKHAYSTQIQECLEYIASNVSDGFTISAKSPDVGEVIDEMLHATPQLVTYDEDGTLVPSVTSMLQEALLAGDVPVRVCWDPYEGVPYLELWESENVEFVMEDARRVSMVVRREQVWRDVEGSTAREETEFEVFRLAPNAFGIMECVREVYWADEEEPHEREWLGVGRIPWMPVRVDVAGLREFRGESMISEQAMESADRYNAVEQQGFLIARYNSHANIAVIGDSAMLKVESEGHVKKDVADVLTFPGGTDLEVLHLPTDPKMIEHQRSVLSEAMHAQFGVTRMEPDALQGLGGVTGYALAILNQKSRGTSQRIINQCRKDWIALVDLVLDVTAWKRADDEDSEDGDVPAAAPLRLPTEDGQWVLDPETMLPVPPDKPWWEVDPHEVFPERAVRIVMGTVDFVDETRVRADFEAGLISRQAALRERGYGPEAIREIMREIAKEKEQDRAAIVGAEGRPTVSVGDAVVNGRRADDVLGGPEGELPRPGEPAR